MLCNGISRLWMVCGGGVLLTNVRWYSSCPSLLVVITARTMLNHTCRICYKPGLNVTLVHHLSFRGNCWALSHKLHFSGIIIFVCYSHKISSLSTDTDTAELFLTRYLLEYNSLLVEVMQCT